MRAMLLAGALLSLVIGSPAAMADDASDRLKIAEQVVAVAHVADNMRSMMPVIMAQLKPLVLHQGETNAADLDRFTKLFGARVDAAADQFAEKVAQIYATEFSAEDLGNLLAFYKTPSGQNLLSKQSAIAQVSLVAGKQLGQDLAKQVVEDMQREKQAKPSKM